MQHGNTVHLYHKLWYVCNNETSEYNNISQCDYKLFIKYLHVSNINISIKNGSKLHPRNLFLSSLGDLLFKGTLLLSRSPAFVNNTRQSSGTVLVRITLRLNTD